MSLPLEVIDRLFQRLGATYGRHWTTQWDGVPIGDVKGAWGHELSGYAGNLKAIAWALENLPERCPNAVEFRNLCRVAPASEQPRLPEPKADPARVAAELSKLAPARAAMAGAAPDHRGWARRIVARHEAGQKVRRICLQFAREALGMEA